MADLHAGPPELEEDGEGRVVDELGPLVGLGTLDAREEDEGEADEDTEQTNQVPGLLLAVFPEEDYFNSVSRSVKGERKGGWVTCRARRCPVCLRDLLRRLY